jgi:PilZ domain-containing protein
VIEQRKSQRFELKLPFQVIRDGANSRTKGETRNLSSSGVLFTTAAAMTVGEPIEYCITLPRVPGVRTDVRLRCIGTILRADAEAAFAATLERYEFVRG